MKAITFSSATAGLALALAAAVSLPVHAGECAEQPQAKTSASEPQRPMPWGAKTHQEHDAWFKLYGGA